jgi:hypothetical protein
MGVFWSVLVSCKSSLFATPRAEPKRNAVVLWVLWIAGMCQQDGCGDFFDLNRPVVATVFEHELDEFYGSGFTVSLGIVGNFPIDAGSAVRTVPDHMNSFSSS